MANRQSAEALRGHVFPPCHFQKSPETMKLRDEAMAKVLELATTGIWLKYIVHFWKTSRVTIHRGIYYSCKLNNSFTMFYFLTFIVCVTMTCDGSFLFFGSNKTEAQDDRTHTGGVAVSATRLQTRKNNTGRQ